MIIIMVTSLEQVRNICMFLSYTYYESFTQPQSIDAHGVLHKKVLGGGNLQVLLVKVEILLQN